MFGRASVLRAGSFATPRGSRCLLNLEDRKLSRKTQAKVISASSAAMAYEKNVTLSNGVVMPRLGRKFRNL